MQKPVHNKEFFKRVLDEVFQEYKKKLCINASWTTNTRLRKNKGVYAEVIYSYKDKLFNIYVNEEKHTNIRTLKDTIIHELCHIMFTPYTSLTDKLLDTMEKHKLPNVDKKRTQLTEVEELLVRKFTRVFMLVEKEKEALQKEIKQLKKR